MKMIGVSVVRNKVREAAIMTLMFILVGCGNESPQPPVCLRSDLVPLKVVMTDYIIDGDGDKLFKIEGSAQLIVPLASHEPRLNGRCFEYLDLPRPVVDTLSTRIDRQVLILNERGLFTSQKADSKRINELRAAAAKAMQELAGSELHVQCAMKNAADVLRKFYEKFDGYTCTIQWSSK